MPQKKPSTRGGRSTASTSHESTQPGADGPVQATTDAAQKVLPSTAAGDSRPTSASSIRRLDTLQGNSLGSPGTTSTRGRGGPSRPIARPRGIGRRSHKDRAELEKAEQDRRQAEAATQARESAWRQRRDLARSRGLTRGRMRGGYAGEIERRKDAPSSAVSGPFSLGEVSKHKSTRSTYSGTGGRHSGGGGGGTTGGAGSSSNTTARPVKQEHGVVPADVHIKQEDGGYISSDDEAEGARKLNIDNLIDLTGDDEDEDTTYLPPVRIQRVEHKERNLIPNAQAVSSTNLETSDTATNTDRRRGRQRSKDVEITGESQRYKGTYTDSSSEDEGQIKPEPLEGDGLSLPQGALHSPPTSPEARRKAKEIVKLSDQGVQKPAFQTKEEELEWDIHERDLRILRAELGQMSLPPNAGQQSVATDAATEDHRADKVYLFQLPAVLPGLVPVVPKAEDEDLQMQDVPEIGAGAQPAESKAAKESILNAGNTSLPSGVVGKLRVHASGKAYLDWGGIPMELSMGQEATFLQDVLVLDSRDTKPNAPDGEDDIAGMAMSMGQVKGKFVVVPEWDKIFEEAA